MRCSLFLLVLAVILCTATSDLDVASLLEIGVRFVLLNLKHAANVTLTDSTNVTLPDSISNTALGSAKFDNVHVYGFNTLEITKLEAKKLDAADDGTLTNLCINLQINSLGLATKYIADIGILNEIPIYGDGDLDLAVSKIKLGLCTNINANKDFSEIYVNDLSLQLKLHDSISSVTGFWKSEEASDIVTLAISVVEQIICMFISYEDECFSCVASQILQYEVNNILPNKIDNDLNIQCSCLEGVSVYSENVGDILEKLVSFLFGDKAQILTEKELEDLKGLFEDIIDSVLKTLSSKGFIGRI